MPSHPVQPPPGRRPGSEESFQQHAAAQGVREIGMCKEARQPPAIPQGIETLLLRFTARTAQEESIHQSPLLLKYICGSLARVVVLALFC